jgi:hypothetical protein
MEESFLSAYPSSSSVISAGKHSWFRSSWLKENFPKCRHLVEKIEKQIPEYLEAANHEHAD